MSGFYPSYKESPLRRLHLFPLLCTWIFTLACDTEEPDERVCPPPTDACMNEDNYQECLDVEADCDGNILILESCPLQFGCES